MRRRKSPFCTRKLNEVERRIEILVKKGDEIGTEPFEAPAGDEAAGSEAGGAGGKSDELF